MKKAGLLAEKASFLGEKSLSEQKKRANSCIIEKKVVTLQRQTEEKGAREQLVSACLGSCVCG